eukprot:gene24095-30398_t
MKHISHVLAARPWETLYYDRFDNNDGIKFNYECVGRHKETLDTLHVNSIDGAISSSIIDIFCNTRNNITDLSISSIHTTLSACDLINVLQSNKQFARLIVEDCSEWIVSEVRSYLHDAQRVLKGTFGEGVEEVEEEEE